MTSIEEFLNERGGGFTADDIAYLANIGLQSLIRDAVPGSNGKLESSKILEVPSPVESEPAESITHIHRLPFGVDIESLPNQRLADNPSLQSLSSCITNITSSGVMPPTLVVGSLWGEEVIAVASGSCHHGAKINILFDHGRILSDDHPAIFQRNLYENNPLTEGLPSLPYEQHADLFVFEMDPLEMHLIVLCQPTDPKVITKWIDHLIPTGILIVTEAKDVVDRVAAGLWHKSKPGEGDVSVLVKTAWTERQKLMQPSGEVTDLEGDPEDNGELLEEITGQMAQSWKRKETRTQPVVQPSVSLPPSGLPAVSDDEFERLRTMKKSEL